MNRIKEIVDRVTFELGVPESEKDVDNFTKRIKVEMELLENDG